MKINKQLKYFDMFSDNLLGTKYADSIGLDGKGDNSNIDKDWAQTVYTLLKGKFEKWIEHKN
jgi:hypothetical protein